MKFIIAFFTVILLISCQAQTQKSIGSTDEAAKNKKGNSISTDNNSQIVDARFENDMLVKIEKSNKEWKAELNTIEYNILREAGTERAFSGDLLINKERGVYTCRACHLPLFESATKFKSGTGWPSFYRPIKEAFVKEIEDNKHGWNRVEVVCARCEGHLGHVFPDGPEPTGLRYCINSYSMDFSPANE